MVNSIHIQLISIHFIDQNSYIITCFKAHSKKSSLIIMKIIKYLKLDKLLKKLKMYTTKVNYVKELQVSIIK